MPENTEQTPSEIRLTRREKYLAEREERKLRHWLVKLIARTGVVLIGLIVLAILYVYVVKGGDFQGSFLGEFLKAVFDILKVLTTPVK